MVDVYMSAGRVDKVAEMQWQPVFEINEEHFFFFHVIYSIRTIWRHWDLKFTEVFEFMTKRWV